MMPMNPYVTLPHYPAANQPIYGQPQQQQQQQQMYDYYQQQQQQAPTYASPQNMVFKTVKEKLTVFLNHRCAIAYQMEC